jgi:chaperonin GroEL
VNDELELKRALDALAKALPEGAPVVVAPSIRARDRGEVVPGMLVPFGLASSAFCDARYGAVAVLDRPDVRVFSGVLRARHLEALLPVLEAAMRTRRAVVLVAEDVDESVVAMLTMSAKNGGPAAALVPHAGAGAMPMHAFAALTVASLGEARDDGIEIQEGGSPPRLFSTIHETIVTGPLPLLDPAARVGVLHVGGEDLAEARARARLARTLQTRALN